MKKRLILTLLGALLLGAAGTATANICAYHPAPAASLLFPFVVFDYNNPTSGANTLLAIVNVSSRAQIVHVTFWSNYSFPVLDFNIVLSGYDVETISVRDILHFGELPVTGTASPYIVSGGQPPTDGPVSHQHGSWLDNILPPPESTAWVNTPYSVADRCSPSHAAYPGKYIIGLDAGDLDTLQFYFTASQLSERLHHDCNSTGHELTDWWTQDAGDGADDLTWVYVTADVVWECNRLFPDSATYWNTQALTDNVIIGDVFWVNDIANFSEADNAVHLEADLELDTVATTDGNGNPISFYYRYSIRNVATSDFREPLPTAWAFRYMGIERTDIDTHIRAWKGSTFLPTIADLSIVGGFYGTYYAYDCLAYSYWAWDEDERVSSVDVNPWSIPGGIDIFPNLLPLETQEVAADEFNTTGDDGWFLFVWPNSNWDAIGGAPAYLPAEGVFDWYQTWMGVKYSAFGRFSAFKSAAVMGNFNCYSDQVLPNLGVEYDYVGPVGYYTSPPYFGP